MASKLTVEQFATDVARALGERLVALLLYGSWARGTHVPGRSDVNTLLICDAVDQSLFETLAERAGDLSRELLDRQFRRHRSSPPFPPLRPGEGERRRDVVPPLPQGEGDRG